MSAKKRQSKSLAKGILAGLVGGLVATAAKAAVERVYPPQSDRVPEPAGGHALVVHGKKVSPVAVRWGFGAVTGAAYGALTEYYPQATTRNGAAFGTALVTLTHEGALPALGLAKHPGDQNKRERRSEMISHVAYGLVAETVRRMVRAGLG